MNSLRLNLFRRIKSQGVMISKRMHQSSVELSTKYILIKSKDSGISREIAYQKHEASQETKILYIPGFMSDKCGIKATALLDFCREKGLSYTRYDPTGLGESRPVSLAEARLSHWIQDAEEILALEDDPQIVVGSSMGGWIALYLCLKFPKKFRGLVLLAPGVNFTKRYRDKIMQLLPKSAIQLLEEGDTLTFDHPEYGQFPISLDLVNDMYQYELDLNQGLNVKCPVRILHGILDEDVPYKESMDLLQSLKSTDVHLTYIKDGDHRLYREENLKLVFDNIFQLMDD